MYYVLPLRKYLSEEGDYAVGKKGCRAGDDRKIFIRVCIDNVAELNLFVVSQKKAWRAV